LSGTIIIHSLSMLVLFLRDSSFHLTTALQAITLPSIILNFMLSLPVFFIIQDIVQQLNPPE